MAPKRPLVYPGGAVAAKRGRSAHDVVLRNIGMAIVKGDYPIGSLLPPKDELMAWLAVSQTTLREALQTLAAKGLIAARAKVGTRVLDESQWNMFDGDILAWRLEIGVPASFLGRLFEIRQTLEPVAAAFAAMRRRPRDVVHLRELAEGLTFSSGDTAAFVRADVLFHEYVLEISGNPFMHSLGALIGTALNASFTLSAPTEHPELSAAVRRQHLDIVDAIEARDAQRASDAMVAVIRQGWANYSGAGAVPVASLAILAFQAG
jgi:DNA-binding FadR family transcriptional regulator